jgi:hypothetical protein
MIIFYVFCSEDLLYIFCLDDLFHILCSDGVFHKLCSKDHIKHIINFWRSRLHLLLRCDIF